MHAAARLSGLPQLTEVRKLWFSGWYDGPITGLARYAGHEYWFVMVTNDQAGGTWDFEPRIYVLHRLSEEQLAQVWDMHRGFSAAGLPGCLHLPPCPTTGGSAGIVDELRARWPPEDEDAFMLAPAAGWFRDA